MAEALRQGLISHSMSPPSPRFFFIEKEEGRLQPCIDYHGLNVVTVKYSHSLPLVPFTIKQLHGSSIYTKLDLWSVYNLVCTRAGDVWKTSFSTMLGHYQNNLMSYGLANALAFFQSLMNDVFRDMVHKFVIVYRDDILIYSLNKREDVSHIRQVLHHLFAHGLYAKVENCELHKPELSFPSYHFGLWAWRKVRWQPLSGRH